MTSLPSRQDASQGERPPVPFDVYADAVREVGRGMFFIGAAVGAGLVAFIWAVLNAI